MCKRLQLIACRTSGKLLFFSCYCYFPQETCSVFVVIVIVIVIFIRKLARFVIVIVIVIFIRKLALFVIVIVILIVILIVIFIRKLALACEKFRYQHLKA